MPGGFRLWLSLFGSCGIRCCLTGHTHARHALTASQNSSTEGQLPLVPSLISTRRYSQRMELTATHKCRSVPLHAGRGGANALAHLSQQPRTGGAVHATTTNTVRYTGPFAVHQANGRVQEHQFVERAGRCQSAAKAGDACFAAGTDDGATAFSPRRDYHPARRLEC